MLEYILMALIWILAAYASLGIGVYLRYRLRDSGFARSNKSTYAGWGAFILSNMLTVYFAMAGFFVPLVVTTLVTSALWTGLTWRDD